MAASTAPTGQIAVEYFPEREGSGSVGDAKAVRLFHLSIPERVTVESTGQVSTIIHTLTLKPGTNWVDAHLWHQGKDHKLVQHRVDQGAIRVRQPLKTDSRLIGSLDEYRVEDAQELVNSIWGIDQLQQLLRLEQRRSVVNVINRRIEALQKGEAA